MYLYVMWFLYTYLGLLPILLHIAKITADAIKLYSTTNGYK